MRTHIYNKLTAAEIEEYLAGGGDTIFLPVGVVELHGEMPIDAETTFAEGYCVAMAEKCNGLVLINLPYFYPGGTVIGNCTVHISIEEGIEYLHTLCRSLVDQGFKKIFLLACHGPAMLTIKAFCRDFYEATHVHPCSINTMSIQDAPADVPHLEFFEKLVCGAHKIMKQEQFIPINPDAVADFGETQPNPPEMMNMISRLRPIGGYASLIFSDVKQHGGGLVFKTAAERDAVCAEGEALIRKFVDKIDFDELLKAVDDYQAYTETVAEKITRLKSLMR